jgi:hypothetical protein
MPSAASFHKSNQSRLQSCDASSVKQAAARDLPTVPETRIRAPRMK